MDKIYISIATYLDEKRQIGLEKAVKSLEGQYDQLFVYLNNYKKIPTFLKGKKNIKCFISSRCDNDLNDKGKFYALQFVESGYFLTCDDDFIYPNDYAKNIVENIEKNKRKAIITHHGHYFLDNPITNYYHGRANRVWCTKENKKEMQVHVGGTGVMGFHTDTIRFSHKDFEEPFMSDVHLSLAAAKLKVPIICPPHKKDFVIAIKGVFEKGILQHQIKKQDVQISKINELLKYFAPKNFKKVYGKVYKFICMPTGNIGHYEWNKQTQENLKNGRLKEI